MKGTRNVVQLQAIRDAIWFGGLWYSLREIEEALLYRYAQSSCSARLREHEAWSEIGFVVEKRLRENGGRSKIYEYRVVRGVQPVEGETPQVRGKTQHPLSATQRQPRQSLLAFSLPSSATVLR